MSIPMALFSPPCPTSFSVNPNFTHKPTLFLPLKRPFLSLSTPKSLPDNGAGVSVSVPAPVLEKAVEGSSGPNGAATSTEIEVLSKFEDPRWIGGTWDLKQFQKNGTTDWDAVIDAGKFFFFLIFAYLMWVTTRFGCLADNQQMRWYLEQEMTMFVELTDNQQIDTF
ncbi:Chlorophyll A-B binding protein [Gossypium australe]|uniref:Chlorophyll A-B binding protein n=1 Tax=Gossypium australe TaxID=47621 RepID=A0A5B6VIN1_9ROSI|nr:Chlorophyll A-B binding protein [Gossypium australe]